MQFDGKGDMRYACAFFVPLETIGVSGVCVFTHALFSHFLVAEHRECTFDATMVAPFSETKLLYRDNGRNCTNLFLFDDNRKVLEHWIAIISIKLSTVRATRYFINDIRYIFFQEFIFYSNSFLFAEMKGIDNRIITDIAAEIVECDTNLINLLSPITL